jgi:hypothetical protein
MCQRVDPSCFVIPTIEYRFVILQNFTLLLFAEGAWYENNSVRTYITDMPYSVGAVMNFETKAGIFSLNYTLGESIKNQFLFENRNIKTIARKKTSG